MIIVGHLMDGFITFKLWFCGVGFGWFWAVGGGAAVAAADGVAVLGR